MPRARGRGGELDNVSRPGSLAAMCETTSAAAFSRRLRHARRERGLSQSALAAGICSPSAISRWEKGQSLPDPSVASALAQRMGIAAEVLTGQGYDPRFSVSPRELDSLIALGFGSRASSANPVISWITIAQDVARSASPWSSPQYSRRRVDDLAIHELTTLHPSAAQMAELLESMVHLQEEMNQTAVTELLKAIHTCADAPLRVRQTALENAIAVLADAHLSTAATHALRDSGLSEVTHAAVCLADWHTSSHSKIPIRTELSARDVLIQQLASARSGKIAASVAARLAASSTDSVVRRFGAGL